MQEQSTRQKLIRQHEASIEIGLIKLGRLWVGSEVDNHILEIEPEIKEKMYSQLGATGQISENLNSIWKLDNKRFRYVLHALNGQWRLTLWYGTCIHPGSIPDFYDADGVDFQENDVDGYLVTIFIAIMLLDENRIFRLIANDKFSNVLIPHYIDKWFGKIEELLDFIELVNVKIESQRKVD